MNEGYLLKTNNKYHLNKNSEYVKVLYETQIKLANIGAKELSKKDNPEKRLSDEELDMIFDEESDFDIDEQLEKLEYEEEKIRIVSFINNKKKGDGLCLHWKIKPHISYLMIRQNILMDFFV